MTSLAFGSSESAIAGASPVQRSSSAAQVRAWSWSMAMTRPPASGCFFADLTQLLVGLHEHGRQPLAVGIEGGAQSGAAVLGGDVVGERGFLHGAVGTDPLHVAIEPGEEDRPHDTTVDECGAVVVLVVADGVAVIAECVANERDRCVVGTKRGAGQQEPRVGLGERFGDALAPGEVTAGMVDFVEDDDAASTQREQCASRRGALGVGDDDAVHVGRDVIRSTRPSRVRGGIRTVRRPVPTGL